jgi:hypothetical protein
MALGQLLEFERFRIGMLPGVLPFEAIHERVRAA